MKISLGNFLVKMELVYADLVLENGGFDFGV